MLLGSKYNRWKEQASHIGALRLQPPRKAKYPLAIILQKLCLSSKILSFFAVAMKAS